MENRKSLQETYAPNSICFGCGVKNVIVVRGYDENLSVVDLSSMYHELTHHLLNIKENGSFRKNVKNKLKKILQKDKNIIKKIINRIETSQSQLILDVYYTYMDIYNKNQIDLLSIVLEEFLTFYVENSTNLDDLYLEEISDILSFIFDENEVLDIISMARIVGENFSELLNREYIIKLYEQKRNENIRKSKRFERYLFRKSGFGYGKVGETEESSPEDKEESFDKEIRFKQKINDKLIPPLNAFTEVPSKQIEGKISSINSEEELNEKGLRIRSFPDETGDEVVAQWRAEPHHQAFPGMLSGGIIGTLLDCHSNWTAAYFLMKKRGKEKPECTVTAKYAVTLLRPTPFDATIHLKARVVESEEDRATVEAELIAQGKVCATCRGLFVIVKEGHPAYHRW